MASQQLSNVLDHSASPYLQQHRDNPVHWQIWGEAALGEAKRSGKPILLSIGYAACHWCHVMAHESFEDQATADVMNDLYINIKVDREERSDIDQIYMAALHAMGEQGGWPLTMFLNSNAEPFWGGTYFPKTASHGRPDFITVLQSISRVYQQEPDKVLRNAQSIKTHLDHALADAGHPALPADDIITKQARGILSIVDARNGGIGQAPKFPNASMLESLWRSWINDGSVEAKDAALQWIQALSNGGIYDHLGGGLSRYCVDARWLVPHFEKMLYDNAQYIRALSWAFAESNDSLFRNRIEETIGWLEREMLMPGGGFASSLDADSEGVEGLFYVWQKTEIDGLLGDDSAFFCSHYDVTATGNWENSNILNRLGQAVETDGDTMARLEKCRTRLLNRRGDRVRPGRDDKILADWNGLLIRALAEAGLQFDRNDWMMLASNAFDFITGSMMTEDRLAHAYCNGVVTYPALASDYGAMINAAVALYQTAGDQKYIDQANRWVDILDRYYADETNGYFYTASDSNDLLLRTRHEHDDATPSAAGQILEALARLSLVSENLDLSDKATQMAQAVWGRVNQMPMAASSTVNAIATIQNPLKLVLVNPANDMRSVIINNPDPARLDIIVTSGDEVRQQVPDQSVHDNNESGEEKRPAAYLCRGPQCLPPVFDAQALDALLRQTNRQN